MFEIREKIVYLMTHQEQQTLKISVAKKSKNKNYDDDDVQRNSHL